MKIQPSNLVGYSPRLLRCQSRAYPDNSVIYICLDSGIPLDVDYFFQKCNPPVLHQHFHIVEATIHGEIGAARLSHAEQCDHPS